MYARHQSLALRLLILLTGACAVFLLVSGRLNASTSEQALRPYQVQPGDTLWEIASEISDEDVDVRVVIAEIKRLNDLDTSSLRSGQSLLIPAT